MAMPEAAARGMLGYVPADELPACLAYLPFLHVKIAFLRHALLAVFISCLSIPTGLLVLSQVLSPPLPAATIALFAGVYVLCISVLVMPMGILGFCVQDNYERAIGMMSMEENWRHRLVHRLCAVPFT